VSCNGFAEIEENEEELGKLKEWYEKIKARDFFTASLREKSKSTLSECADTFKYFVTGYMILTAGHKETA